MERLTPVNFLCDQCHEPHNKVLPPRTNFTTCHRCGSLIDVSRFQNMSYRQRQLNQNINFQNYQNNPFEQGEAFPIENETEDIFFYPRLGLYNNNDDDSINNNEEDDFNNFWNNNRNRNRNRNINNRMFNINIPNPNYNRNAERRHRMYMLGIEDPEREIERLNMQISLLRGNSIQIPKIKIKLKKEKMSKKFWVKNDKDVLEEPNCCICLCSMKIGENVTKLKCGHLFHFKCLDKWVENKDACPFCRGKINEKRSKTTKKK